MKVVTSIDDQRRIRSPPPLRNCILSDDDEPTTKEEELEESQLSEVCSLFYVLVYRITRLLTIVTS